MRDREQFALEEIESYQQLLFPYYNLFPYFFSSQTRNPPEGRPSIYGAYEEQMAKEEIRAAKLAAISTSRIFSRSTLYGSLGLRVSCVGDLDVEASDLPIVKKTECTVCGA